MEKEQTFYQELKAKGYTRRQFLKFCGIMGAMLGLHQTGIAQVVNALQTKPRKPVLWFHFQECTCCSESFLRSSHPLVGQILLEMISLDYSDTLMAASGFQAEEVRTRSMKENWGKYIMIVEGSIPLGNPGYCTIAGHSAKQVFDEAAHGASAIIAWGNCASSGCKELTRTRQIRNPYIKLSLVNRSLTFRAALLSPTSWPELSLTY